MKTNELIGDALDWDSIINPCANCKHAISPQGYFHACNSPERLQTLKRFHYVERFPTAVCQVPKKATV